MKKQLLILGIVVLLVCVGLSGCNEVSDTLNPEKNKFVGTWSTQQPTGMPSTMIFYADGTTPNIGGGIGGTWELKEGNLLCSGTISGSTVNYVYTYSFSNNEQTLTLTMISPQSREATVYTKQ
jgi:hypothetical protein